MPHFVNELRATFERHASRPAVLHRGRTWTYAELDAAARGCAALLQSLHVAAGDRVALFTDQKLPLLVANLGAWLAGAVPLPLNPRFTREEMRYYLSDSGARVVVAGSDHQPLVAQLCRELPQPPAILPDSTLLSPPARTAFREAPVGEQDPCLILYSSGTTGWPKGVVHTQANVASSLHALAQCWEITPADIVVNVLPLFHIHGLAFATHATWLAGGCVRIEDSFEPAQTLAAIGEGTIFMAVPPIYYKLLDEPAFVAAAKQWRGVRLFTCGSAPIRTEVLPRLQEILGRPVINRYGMSEAYVITSLPLAGPWPDGSVGLPLDGVELRIQAGGQSASAGKVGAVQIRGPNIFCQYWSKPEATAAAFSDGWFDTGDLGQLDSAGMLTLVGRQHDLIITSGYNVYPQVVERVIGECPGVRECAVLGLPDQSRGERVAAAVVRSETTLDEARLRDWWQDRLVHYQQPKSILFVESLPKNSLGKVLRRELRERFGQ